MGRKRATQNDVARLAGVSRGTVSLVLNSQATRVPISEETRQRVLRAMQELGYEPDPIAQMLARGRSHLIGVFTYEPVFPYEGDDFYYPFLLGIEREANEQDYNVLLFTRNRTVGHRRIYADGTNSLRLADGAILLGPNPDRQELRRLAEEQYPFVFIGRREVPGCEIDWVASDYGDGSTRATHHLIELGHRSLVFTAREPIESYVDRMAGCERAVAEVEGVELHVLPQSVWQNRAEFWNALQSTGATAVICDGMITLNSLLICAQDRGVRVPEDLSLLSLTDEALPLLPSLRATQVRLNRAEVGRLALKALVDRLDGHAPGPQHIRVACEFVIGNTTAPAH